MKFREQQNPGEGPIKLDLTDVLQNKEKVEFGPQHEAVSVSRYREMVEAMVLELTDSNPILQRIKNGDNITATETEALAKLLNEAHPHITEDLLRKAYQNRKAKFIQFIRHILGIEILANFTDTVSLAFEQFVAEHSNLNSRQLEFLRLLKEFIIEREQVEKRDLIQSPFTVIHPQGIRGVFNPDEINDILQTHRKTGGMSIEFRKTTQDELDLIIDEGEGYSLEFKQSINTDLAKEFVAFANASGGRVFLGINDQKSDSGL